MADPWDFEAVYASLHDFVRGYRFDPDREDYLVHITTGTHVVQICWFLLTESRFIPGRLLQTSPPKRRGTPGALTTIDLDLSKYDRLAMRFAQAARDDLSFLKAGIETKNKAFNEIIERLERVASASKAPILLTGPTGVGKSQLARRLYQLKRNKRQVEGELVEVNCATLRGDGAMSALFGHVKGAFTGALGARTGLLRTADHGLLFLDEIGELGLDEQAMLLRALEERSFLPVGADREVQSDFLLIAGTNRDLQAAVRAGTFREDLLARINLWTFGLPPLRERPEDIAPNLDYELTRYAEANGTSVALSREARELFLRYATTEARWPGNFRDFNAAIVRMATLSTGGRITLDDVRAEIEHQRRFDAQGGEPDSAGPELLGRFLDKKSLAHLDPFDRVQLEEVVRTCIGSRTLSDAGRKLFAVSRREKSSQNDADRLRKYLGRFGLSWAQLTA
jgi:transcriptional regulatory protein RtcR